MEHWSELLVNGETIEDVFGNIVPSLTGAELVELVVDENGPTLRIRINLAEFPKTPPKKWVEDQANTIQITLAAAKIRHLAIQGAPTQMNVSISLSCGSRGARIP